jgi:hypothetical protein
VLNDHLTLLAFDQEVDGRGLSLDFVRDFDHREALTPSMGQRVERSRHHLKLIHEALFSEKLASGSQTGHDIMWRSLSK